jgi:hypothetical protein
MHGYVRAVCFNQICIKSYTSCIDYMRQISPVVNHSLYGLRHLMLQYRATLPVRPNLGCRDSSFSLMVGTNPFPKTQFVLIFNIRPWTNSMNQ